MKATMRLDVEFDENLTDAESLASAMDKLLETALSVGGPDIWEDYGPVKVGEFFPVTPPEVFTVRYLGDVDIVDRGTGNVEELEVWRDSQSGGVFAIDATFLDQVAETIPSPFNANQQLRLPEPIPALKTVKTEYRPAEETKASERPPAYVIFDYDANELATTQVYRDYKEAAKDADQLDNVLVATIDVDLGPVLDDADDEEGYEEPDEQSAP